MQQEAFGFLVASGIPQLLKVILMIFGNIVLQQVSGYGCMAITLQENMECMAHKALPVLPINPVHLIKVFHGLIKTETFGYSEALDTAVLQWVC